MADCSKVFLDIAFFTVSKSGIGGGIYFHRDGSHGKALLTAVANKANCEKVLDLSQYVKQFQNLDICVFLEIHVAES